MSIYYFYLILLISIFLIVYYGVSCSFKFAPLKIRIVSSAAFIIIGFRYIALLVFLITKNIKNLYLLKPMMFLNLLCIPVLAMVSMYILARNDKIKFDYCMIGSLILTVFYTVAILKIPVNIEVYKNCGYIMSFNNGILVYGIYLIVHTIFFFLAMAFLENKNSNKIGMWFILGSAFVSSAELVLAACGMKILPVAILGDVLWIATATFAINKLRR